MIKRISLTEYAFSREDVDYSIVDGWGQLTKDCIPNQPFNGIIKSESDFQKLIKVASLNVNEPERILHEKTIQKWLVSQGGSFSKEQLLLNIENQYYGNDPEFTVELPEDFGAILYASLHRANIFFPNWTEWFINDAIELYQCYKGDHKSSPGLTGKGDRRDKENIVKAISQAKESPTDMDPAKAWMRYKDGKYRNIFVDSFANYFRGCFFLKRLFEWIGDSPMSVHYSDMYLAELIVKCNAAAAYAADFKGMDMHFNLDTFKQVLKLCAMLFHIPGDQLGGMMEYAEELFYQHLLTPDAVYVGLHNLFSGIYPTHDIEGYMNMFTLIYVFTKLGFKFAKPGRPLKKNEFTVIVCGDDSIVLLGSELDYKVCAESHASIAALWGQELEVSKVEYSTQWITFCKKTFALRRDVKGFKRIGEAQIPMYKYSVAKALNALYHPENIPSFPKKTDLIIWFCSIMDCAAGCTSWKSTVLTVIQLNPELFGKYEEASEISPELRIMLNSDWWFRNYAEFDLPNSATFALIKSYFNK